MWGKISDDIVFTCEHCGYRVNPYTVFGFIGYSPEQVFNLMPTCPKCGYREWRWWG